jgi:hypothetical protein
MAHRSKQAVDTVKSSNAAKTRAEMKVKTDWEKRLIYKLEKEA